MQYLDHQVTEYELNLYEMIQGQLMMISPILLFQSHKEMDGNIFRNYSMHRKIIPIIEQLNLKILFYSVS